jgi:uncharacterized damage-inducible protein DinB
MATTTHTHETAKTRLLKNYKPESGKTKKVLRAYPSTQAEFRPHERSNDAMQLAWTFLMEQHMLLNALRSQQVLGAARPDRPATWDAMVGAVEAKLDEVVAELESPNNPELEGSVEFFTGPQQRGHYQLTDFADFMLFDQIHHRGQMSVYLRMAGGKVPALYGPSDDEPWI